MKSKLKCLITLLCLLISTSFNAQVKFEKTKHDFGDITNISDRYIDIRLTNKGLKKEYILSVKKPQNIVYLVNGQFLEPDSSLIIRLQINPITKGRFSEEVQIYTSDKDLPTIIKLTANITKIVNNNNSFKVCPDFNTTPSQRNNQTNFELTVVTIDQETRQPIPSSNVSVIKNGIIQWSKTTDKNGIIQEKTDLGFTYFRAQHPNYESNEIGGYVNFKRNYVEIELIKKKNLVALISENEQKESETYKEDKLIEGLTQEYKTDTTSNTLSKEFKDIDLDDFNDVNFMPANITFILDISASMRMGEKMELMKFALIQLSEMLRIQDNISIVTYSSDAQILLKPTEGVAKEKIKTVVSELRAGGMTAGGAGIKLGYKTNLKSYNENGVNQIIIITDGDFNRNSGDYLKYVKKYKKKGINMSVVGILNSEKDKEAMRDIAQKGGGRYIPIFKLSDANQNLKQEIRKICFRP